MERLTKIIADFYGVSYYKLFTKSRMQPIAKARQMIWYIARKKYGSSYTFLGEFFFKGHDTALYGVEAIKKDLEYNKQTREEYNKIQAIIDLEDGIEIMQAKKEAEITLKKKGVFCYEMQYKKNEQKAGSNKQELNGGLPGDSGGEAPQL